MWSFATSAPKRLVMSRSSSARSALELATPPGSATGSATSPCYLTVFGILIPPARIFAMIALTLVLIGEGTDRA